MIAMTIWPTACLAAFSPIPVASGVRPSVLYTTVAAATHSIPGTLSMKTDPTCDNPGLLQGINPTDAKAWSRSIDRKAAVSFLSKEGCGYEEAMRDAKERKKSFEDNLRDYLLLLQNFAQSDQILVDDFETELDSSLEHLEGGLFLVTGGISLGKSVAISKKMKTCESKGDKLCVVVNGRLFPGKLAQGLAYELAILQATDWLRDKHSERISEEEFKSMIIRVEDLAKKAATRAISTSIFADKLEDVIGKDGKDFVLEAFNLLLPDASGTLPKAPEAADLVNRLLEHANYINKHPVFVFDQANEMLATEKLDECKNIEPKDKQLTAAVFSALVSATKQEKKALVYLVVSFSTYVSRLDAYGVSLAHFTKVIFVEEALPVVMWNFLTEKLGMGDEFASFLVALNGGHLLDIWNTLICLAGSKHKFHAHLSLPSFVEAQAVNELLEKFPEARSVCDKLVESGVAVVESGDVKLMEKISELGIGILIRSDMVRPSCNLPMKQIIGTNTDYILPHRQSMRLKLACILHNYDHRCGSKQEAQEKEKSIFDDYLKKVDIIIEQKKDDMKALTELGMTEEANKLKEEIVALIRNKDRMTDELAGVSGV